MEVRFATLYHFDHVICEVIARSKQCVLCYLIQLYVTSIHAAAAHGILRMSYLLLLTLAMHTKRNSSLLV